MVHYVVLTTGSCGNCYIFFDGKTSVVIDCGVTYKKFSDEMALHEIPQSSLSAVFLTHVHPDHAKGIGVLQRKTGVPVFVSNTCYHNGKQEMLKQKMELKMLSHFDWGQRLEIGDFGITAFHTTHDSPGSSGYFLENGSDRFFLMTDTGTIPEEAFAYARMSNVKFIESNYDEEMLQNGPYPTWLKERVRGMYGHLGNKEAIDFTVRSSRQGDQVYFIHVSENNNDTSLLRKEAYAAVPSGIFLKICERGEMFEGFTE